MMLNNTRWLITFVVLAAPLASAEAWRGSAVDAVDNAIAAARGEGRRCRVRVLGKLYKARSLAAQRLHHGARNRLRTARIAAALSCSRRMAGAIDIALSRVGTRHHGGAYPPTPRQPPVGACSSGYACKRQGESLRSRGLHRQAYAMFQRACAVYGSLSGCVSQGYSLEKGLGLPPDHRRAARLYRRACNGRYANGCNNLGAFYQKGWGGMPRDTAQARDLYRYACQYGSRVGCSNLRALGGGMRRAAAPRPRRVAMSAGSFAGLAAQVRQASYSKDKVAVISTAARHNRFTCAQVSRLLRALSYSNSRTQALRLLAPRIVDRQNSHTIISAFTYSSGKRTARQILNGV